MLLRGVQKRARGGCVNGALFLSRGAPVRLIPVVSWRLSATVRSSARISRGLVRQWLDNDRPRISVVLEAGWTRCRGQLH